jgi:hypothetical protein
MAHHAGKQYAAERIDTDYRLLLWKRWAPISLMQAEVEMADAHSLSDETRRYTRSVLLAANVLIGAAVIVLALTGALAAIKLLLTH